MKARVQRLRAEIRFDRDAFAVRVAELGSIDLGPASGPAPPAQAAVALHHAYGSLEAIMTRLARQIDGDLPAGADWHQSLLHVMGLAIDGIRPALFSPESVRVLRELLSFRHFFRRAYAADLDAGRLDTLRQRLIAAAPRILAELDALDSFLSAAAHDE